MNEQFVMIAETLSRLAMRVADREYDPRHAILDIAAELLAIEGDADRLPPALASELRDLLAEVRQVQPPFPSRRQTSPLFDRSGLGRPGHARAERLVRRLVSLAKAVQKSGLEPPRHA